MAAPSDRSNWKSLEDLARSVDALHLRALPVPVLEGMDEDLGGRQAALLSEANQLEQDLQEHLGEGSGSTLHNIRKQIRRRLKEHKEIEEERRQVYEARQERILEDNLVQSLGSRRRLNFVQAGILFLIVLILVLLLYEFFTPAITVRTRQIIFGIDTLCCIVFLWEFFLRLRCAESKRWFWRRHWIDFITSIPIPDYQMLRVGRLARFSRILRIMRFIRVLRALRIFLFFWRGMDKINSVLDVRLMKRALILSTAFLLIGAFTIYLVEGRHDPAVGSFWESLWWSLTTVVTAGFGDIYNPNTVYGRILTMVLVLAGMILVGIFTATLTSVLVEDETGEISLIQERIEKKLDAIQQRLERMERAQRKD